MKQGIPEARSGPSAASVSPPTPTRPHSGPAETGRSCHASANDTCGGSTSTRNGRRVA